MGRSSAGTAARHGMTLWAVEFHPRCVGSGLAGCLQALPLGGGEELIIQLKFDRESRPVIAGLVRVSTPGRRVYVGANEAFEFNVGGTLYVEANQAPGTYVGSFSVTVNYP